MRGGILIIGSLIWDNRREEWRQSRLSIDQRSFVRAPIRYWRRSSSRGGTFTMTFAPDCSMGKAVLVPFREPIVDWNSLVGEANHLWKAERPGALPSEIGSGWGCVGALFSPKTQPTELQAGWASHFRKKRLTPIPPVDKNGVIDIPWPTCTPIYIDVILATATKADAPCPSAEAVADAWVTQDEGYEHYFFENVLHGIRTPDDLVIWERFAECRPDWLSNSEHKKAMAILQREAARQE